MTPAPDTTNSRSPLRSIKPKIIGAPGRYVQGVGALDLLGQQLKAYGDKPLIVCDNVVWPLLGDRVTASLAEAGLVTIRAPFGGECSRSEIERLSALFHSSNCNAVVGLGGGKTLDTAKAISLDRSVPIVIVPTIASNDAPTSRVIVIYSEEGALVEVRTMPFNPHLVLVDTQVIASAPARFLVAGMGDALPTKFEAEQSQASGALNMFQGRQTRAGMVLADACYRLVREYGLLARQAVEMKLVTEAVELVVEACVYHSGLGFESGGLAAAHALTRGFSVTSEMKGSLHGEEVAFGLLVQFVIENRSRDFLLDLLSFYRSIGLPCTLADLGLKNATDKHFRIIAEKTLAEGSHIYKMTTPVDERSLIDAIRFIDAMGQELYPESK